MDNLALIEQPEPAVLDRVSNPGGLADGIAPKIESHPSANRCDVAETVLGPITWLSDSEGFVSCPGHALHTHRTGARDCKLYLDPVPALTCFHASCRELVEAGSRKLRSALAGEAATERPANRRPSPEERRRLAELRRKETTRRRAASSRAVILQRFGWPLAEIIRQSPAALAGDEPQHWRRLLGLFGEDDVIWIGDTHSSGKPEHARQFRTRAGWLSEPMAPAQFVCPAVFKPGVHARSNDNLVARRFLVVESDELTKDEVGGVFRWLRDEVGLHLRAIVDTAGRSLHGWFDFPATDQLEDLKLVLPELGCDPKLFTASQPVRLPGAVRNGRFQRLVWLSVGGAR